jgi:hypothetical protein
VFSLLLNEVVEEPDKRNTMMATSSPSNPEFTRFYEQRRKDEKNALFQTFINELEDVIHGIKRRRANERSFNNSIGHEVKVIDFSDIRVLQVIQASLKFNLDNINLIISLSEYFEVFFVDLCHSGNVQEQWMELQHSHVVHRFDRHLPATAIRLESSEEGIIRLTSVDRRQSTGQTAA